MKALHIIACILRGSAQKRRAPQDEVARSRGALLRPSLPVDQRLMAAARQDRSNFNKVLSVAARIMAALSGCNAMGRFWIRLTNGTTERWAVFAGEDGIAAHMRAVALFAGTGWRVCWPDV
jgi:hypothetical protein